MAMLNDTALLSGGELELIALRPKRLEYASAWTGHIPFAHWLMGAAAPRTLVELGTHNGVSYSAFCEASLLHGGRTKLYAVDTWLGDRHARYAAGQVFDDFKRFHDRHYHAISTMMRMTFDEALGTFEDGTVDVLHIDGLHTYEAVKHDFQTWRPKLSDRGIVLFHDTQVRREDFGVWKLWAELSSLYPSFEFTHSSGLGVLCVGDAVPEPLQRLCAQAAAGRREQYQSLFGFAGDRWQAEADLLRLRGALHLDRLVSLRRLAGRLLRRPGTPAAVGAA